MCAQPTAIDPNLPWTTHLRTCDTCEFGSPYCQRGRELYAAVREEREREGASRAPLAHSRALPGASQPDTARAWKNHRRTCQHCELSGPGCDTGRLLFERHRTARQRGGGDGPGGGVSWWKILVGVACAIVILAAVLWVVGQIDLAMKIAECEGQGGTYGRNAFGVQGCFNR